MLSLTEIKQFYPSLVPGFEKNIIREYLQYKILSLIFTSPIGKKMSFLGGTAIKICYGGTRFSEDLDFDNVDLTQQEFDELSQYIQKKMELEGYRIEIRNVFKGAFRCYIKFPQLLKENNLSVLENEKIMIQVDTSPHYFGYEPIPYILQKFDIFKTIRLTPMDIILSQKVGAILGRKREKGRDFYDLIYLMGKADFNMDYLEQKLHISSRKELKDKLLEKTAHMDFKVFARDVSPFLIRKEEEEQVLYFREYIEQKL